jgi:hypothetical protein
MLTVTTGKQQLVAAAPPALTDKVGQQKLRQRNRALFVTLRGAHEDRVPDLNGVARDGDTPAQQVKITDTQADRFTPPQTGIGQQQHQRFMLAGSRG